ncbi:MAG: DUF2815 family protein [Clostridiales bacterium]|nr:DUF2815 family protein [Clostridiales bacterium]
MEYKNSGTKVITGMVRLSYANIWNPVAVDEGQEPKYSTSLIIPKSDTKTLDAINKAIEAAKAAGLSKWGGKIPANLKLPLRDGDTDRPNDENYKGCYFINASSRVKPGIVDIGRSPILNQEEVYSGCYAVASINFYAFNTSGNKGIAAGLNNIMKVAGGKPLSGKASPEQDFEGIDIEGNEPGDYMLL